MIDFNTNDDLVTPKTLDLAKNIGYVHSIHSLYIMPSKSYLQMWLRTRRKLHITVNVGKVNDKLQYYSNVISLGKHHKSKYRSKFYVDYRDALEDALENAILIIKNK